MKININNDTKIVEVWLTKEEQNDSSLCDELKDIYKKYKQKKYLVAVFKSGDEDLYQKTFKLLLHNKKYC